MSEGNSVSEQNELHEVGKSLVRIEEQMKTLFSKSDEQTNNTKEVFKILHEFKKEIRHDLKSEIALQKEEISKRVDTNAECIKTHGEDISAIKAVYKSMTFIISLAVSLAGVVLGKLWK